MAKLPRNWQSMSNEEKQEWLAVNTSTSTQTRGLKLDVNVDAEAIKEVVEKNSQLEQELEAERTKAEDLESKLKIVAQKRFEEKKEKLGAPSYIQSVDELKRWQEAQSGGSGGDPVGRGGSGNLPLSPAQMGQKDGFDSQEELVEFLVDQKHMGTPEERKNAEAILNKLYEKTYSGLREGTGKQGTIFVDNPKERGESIIMRALRRNNERLAKKAMERRGIKNE